MQYKFLSSFIVFLTAFSLSSLAFSQGVQNCKRCDNLLELSHSEFVCLKAKLPKIANRKTKFVFFSLSEKACANEIVDNVRSSDTHIPKVSKKAPRVYRLTKQQVTCMSDNIDKVEQSENTYSINLEKLCL